MMTRRVLDESTARDDYDSTRDSSLSRTRRVFFLALANLLARVGVSSPRARFVRLGSFDPRARPPGRSRDRNFEFARSRRARDGSTSTTTRNGDGSFMLVV